MIRKPRAYAGQALVEYLWVIVVIALVCIPAMIFVNEAQQVAFAASEDALNTSSLADTVAESAVPNSTPTPTVTPAPTVSPYNVPTDEEDCKKQGWRTFVTPDGKFKNQPACIRWVRAKNGNTPDQNETEADN